jgi:PAS domain S-box-containing protein
LQIDHIHAEEILGQAIAFLQSEDVHLRSALDELPAPIYVTDAEGLITYFNAACITMAGRTPELGRDRWCVTWKLYTTEGAFLPHDQCPMATAIRTRQPVRGASAVAERPDGTRIGFVPFPTPLFDEDGKFIGAVNLLMDVTNAEQASFLRTQADKCRRLARSVTDSQTKSRLLDLASEYDKRAGS